MSKDRLPLKLIRVASGYTMEEMGKNFLVTRSYISALEKGKRNINLRTLKYGLDNLHIPMASYVELSDFCQRVTEAEHPTKEQYRLMVIKAMGIVNPKSKEAAESLLARSMKELPRRA